MKTITLKKTDIIKITRCCSSGTGFRENEYSFETTVGDAIENGDFSREQGTMAWSAETINCSDNELNGRDVRYESGIASVMVEDDWD